MSISTIAIRGARAHNLKDVSLELPRDQLIVFTGLSGSGKSSLAFDTIYAEGQRRYVESLSAYARQFLGQMDKPDVDFIEGLSPAISIDQKTASRNPRSTVGTVTEIHDYLRLLYARIGIAHCPNDGRPVQRQSPERIVDQILEMEEGTRFQILAPVVQGRKGEYEGLLNDLAREGFARAIVDGEVTDLTEAVKLDRYFNHTIDVIVDRLVAKPGMKRRLAASVETALRLADGVLIVATDSERLPFSQALSCPLCGISFDELQPRNFSFNSPYGACAACSGIGTRYQVDPDLVVPNPERSIAEGAIAPWNGHRGKYFQRLLEGLAVEYDFDVAAPFAALSEKSKEIVLTGGGDDRVKISYANRFGRRREYYTTYEGVLPFVRRKHEEAESDGAREYYQEFMREVPCGECHGTRYNPFPDPLPLEDEGSPRSLLIRWLMRLSSYAGWSSSTARSSSRSVC